MEPSFQMQTSVESPYSRHSCTARRPFSCQIAITAQTGSGKSTLLESLRESFGALPIRAVSAGELFRMRARECGFASIEEFALHNLLHPKEGHDKWCDSVIVRLAQHNWVLAEGRLVHVFMPRAFRVLLLCEAKARATRRASDHGVKYGIALAKIQERDSNDSARYSMLYPGSLWPVEAFDIVVRTDTHSVQDCVRRIRTEHEAWRTKQGVRLIRDAIAQ